MHGSHKTVFGAGGRGVVAHNRRALRAGGISFANNDQNGASAGRWGVRRRPG